MAQAYLEICPHEEPEVTDEMVQAAAMIRKAEISAGWIGPLHIQIDDFNLGDEFFQYPLDVSGYEDDISAENLKLFVQAHAMMAKMTIEQRAWVAWYYNDDDGYWRRRMKEWYKQYG